MNKQESSIPTLSNNVEKVESSYDKAVLLNSYFHQCFNTLVPPLDDHQSHLNPSSFPAELLCTEDVMFDMIAELNCNKSSGPDDVSARMLKGIATSVTPSLTRLFNLLLSSGCFPDAWKMARVVHVPKSTDMSVPPNYRLISIPPIISKVLERVVYQYIFCLTWPISFKQWGFLPCRSTTSALLSVMHNWLQQLDLGYDVCTVYFDLCKAFDSVPHQPLLKKLLDIQLNP